MSPKNRAIEYLSNFIEQLQKLIDNSNNELLVKDANESLQNQKNILNRLNNGS